MNKDEIKENIATFRAYSLLIATFILSFFGYALANVNKLVKEHFIFGFISLVILIATFLYCNKRYKKELNKLKDLK